MKNLNNRFDIEFVKYEFAKYSFKECLNFLYLYKELNNHVNDNLSFGNMVSTAFVISYARPFSKSNREYHGMRMGSISTKWLKQLRKGLSEKHEYLVGTGRNSLAAHIDLGKLMPNVFVKDGPYNDYVFDLHIPSINEKSFIEYAELTNAALDFCKLHQKILKSHISSNHLIPEVYHPLASRLIKR